MKHQSTQKETPLRTASRLIPVLAAWLAFAAPANANDKFRAHLSDGENVPAFDSPTNAQGQVLVKIGRDGGLHYKLIVANLQNAFAAHIHCGPVGVAGPIGVTLFATLPSGAVSVNGILAQGPILAPDAENACGWTDIDDVLDALDSGDTYVNVHTLQSFPGEIRGQLH
jgi:hypothetical protein